LPIITCQNVTIKGSQIEWKIIQLLATQVTYQNFYSIFRTSAKMMTHSDLMNQLIKTSSSETSLQALAALSRPESAEIDAPCPRTKSRQEAKTSPGSKDSPNLSKHKISCPATPKSHSFLDVTTETPEPKKFIDTFNDSGYSSPIQDKPDQSVPKESSAAQSIPDVTATIIDVLTRYILSKVTGTSKKSDVADVKKVQAPKSIQAGTSLHAQTAAIQAGTSLHAQTAAIQASAPDVQTVQPTTPVKTRDPVQESTAKPKPDQVHVKETPQPPSDSTVIARLSRDPAFQDLHQTLVDDCGGSNVNPVTLIQSQNASATEPSIRESTLTMQFKLLEEQAGGVATDLYNFYKFQMMQQESERFKELYVTPTNKLLINAYYDNLQNALINRITKSLNLLKTSVMSNGRGLKRKSESAVDTNSVKKHRTMFSKKAITVLNEWYNVNASNPYPTPEAVQVLSEVAEIQPEQVKKWLSNKRSRNSNVAKKQQYV
jgi:hypothetical protein